MRQRKRERARKRQTGQYMTPEPLARSIVSRLDLKNSRRILEPSCGDGVFLTAIADQIARTPVPHVQSEPVSLIGVEVDPMFADRARNRVRRPKATGDGRLSVEVHESDFFRAWLGDASRHDGADSCDSLSFQPHSFDLIVGNPPFGGTFDDALEDRLDRVLGTRSGRKIKKETYSFFIVACVDLLRAGGRLVFVCSDSMLTIPTMAGLRHHLMSHGDVSIQDVKSFSDETSYPMIVLDFVKRSQGGTLVRNGTNVKKDHVLRTPNLSWKVTPDLAELFRGQFLGDYLIASSGMTTGKNDYFVRRADPKGVISEPYTFKFVDARISVTEERAKCRLGRLPERRRRLLEEAAARGDTQRRLVVAKRDEPLSIQMPDARYRPYNKANGKIVFSEPTHYIYWENDGEAVLTYKKTGNWYLRGVGGQPFFGREGLTWQLVASRFVARYLPSGYILDSGAPCAFLRDGVDRDELFYILGWLLSPLARRILKEVINHTRNIQSKDFERMPYPWWLNNRDREVVVRVVKEMISQAGSGKSWSWDDDDVTDIGARFDLGSGGALESPASGRNREARGYVMRTMPGPDTGAEKLLLPFR